MKNLIYPFAIMLLFHACSSTKPTTDNSSDSSQTNKAVWKGTSTDETYGYTQKKPIKVGGTEKSQGPSNERLFLNNLAGPNGETLQYERIGSCCAFPCDKAIFGEGLLDKYKVTWIGQEKPIILYLNMYEYGDQYVPIGMTAKN